VNRARARFVRGDQSLPHELRERLFERDRPVALRDRNLLMQMLQRVLANVLAAAVPNHQQLGCGHAAASCARHERLRQHGAQRHR
jgi:hypothetical protein